MAADREQIMEANTVANLSEYIQLCSETILEFPRIDGDRELDIIINHAQRYGKCLFQVAGDNLIRIYPVEEE